MDASKKGTWISEKLSDALEQESTGGVDQLSLQIMKQKSAF